MSQSKNDFSRIDQRPDAEFYARPRLVDHLDREALATVRKVIGQLVTEDQPVILDLMASWDSHLPPDLEPKEMVGLGLNQIELEANLALDRHLIHDLNADPALPLPDAAFDVVLNTVSVDYLVDPVAVFKEVGRVLKPGGLHLVIFSNRWFEPKVTRLWREAPENERVLLVQDWFQAAGLFEDARVFLAKGRPRPVDDKYAHLGLPSDPVWVVYADRLGGDPARAPRPEVRLEAPSRPDPELVARRASRVKETHQCPHCGKKMRKWAVPQTPFTQWENDFMYVCFNDTCSYLVGGWSEMSRQGNTGYSYRLMYNPETDCLIPISVPSLATMRDGIID